MTSWAFVTIAALFGLLVGSFTNVLISRIPSGANWVSDSSRCLACEQGIAWYDNVPLLSWLLLRGRCRRCQSAISWRYPAVELAVAALFALVVATFGFTVWTGVLLFLAMTTVALAVIDFQLMRLPSALIYPSAGVIATGVVVIAAMAGDWGAVLRAAASATALGGVYFVLWFVYPQGLGFGDVRLAFPLGAALGFMGWGTLAVGAIAAPVLGMVWSVGAMLKAGKAQGVKIPFGPWMIVGFWLAVFWGASLWNAYLDWAIG